MYEGITYKKFLTLPMEEKCVAYRYLSDHDKFRARVSYNPYERDGIKESDLEIVETPEQKEKRIQNARAILKEWGIELNKKE